MELGGRIVDVADVSTVYEGAGGRTGSNGGSDLQSERLSVYSVNSKARKQTNKQIKK